MSWHDWLLFLHVGSAFLFGMALVSFWGAVVVGSRPGDADPETLALTLVRPANVLVAVGAFGALIFGVWLAIVLDAYQPWDGWILASLVIWVIGVGVGNLSGSAFERATRAEGADALALRRRGVLLHAASSIAYLTILVLMIFKPGA